MLLTQSMSLGEKLLSTIAITILGMVVVYIVLIIIAYSLKLFKVIFNEKPKKATIERIVESKEELSKEESIEDALDDGENTELVLLITAAIAAFEGTSGENLIVRSIKEMPQSKSVWAAAGRQQLMSANNIIKMSR